MAAIDATNIPNAPVNPTDANAPGATGVALNPKTDIVYRPLVWNDIDAAVELFDRTWPQNIDLLGERNSLLISRYFVLHYLQPTTFANAAFTQDGTLAGVTFIRVAGEAPQFDDIEVGEEMADVVRLIMSDEKAAKQLRMLDEAYALQHDLEKSSRANETTMGELELFMVNPEIRGKGVGGQLWNRMQEHFAAWDVPAFYLHTDSDCDVSFYDHKGLQRIAEHLGKSAESAESSESAESLEGESAEEGLLYDDMFIYRGEVAQL